jgi:hypothetical protein
VKKGVNPSYTLNNSGENIMATKGKPLSIELGELIEASAAAVERAMGSRKLRYPFDVTVGLIFQPNLPFPIDGLGGQPLGIPSEGELTPRDHTVIVRAVMDNALAIVRVLGEKAQKGEFTDDEALSAALKVDAIDPTIKVRISEVLSVRKKLGKSGKIPSSVRKLESELQKTLKDQGISEKIAYLRDADPQGDITKQGLETAALILADGQDELYYPNDPFYEQLTEGVRSTAKKDAGDHASDVANSDAVGGALGAGAGSVVAGVGAAPGGVAGAAGASVGAIIGKLAGWLFG